MEEGPVVFSDMIQDALPSTDTEEAVDTQSENGVEQE
jgi:hypothetical protein